MAIGDVLGFASIQIEPDMSPFKKATAVFAAAGAAAGAVIVAGVNEAIGQANVTSTLQAQLGTTAKVAADQGKIAGKLYSTGVSGTFQEAADAIKSTVQAGLAPPGTTNAQLQQIATKAQDVATVFGQDLTGVTNSVSQLMRTGLAKNSGEAFDIITKGFQTGADKAGDFLDTINEYGTQFRKAGLTGQDAIGLINQGLEAGARDADIVADAIKEFSIRAVDGSKLTADGFKSLGLNADDMAKKFSQGGTVAKGALDLTLDRLRGIEDPVKRAQVATALFGTQAEDLGDALFALDPSAAAKKVGDFAGATEKMGKTIRSGPSYEIQIFMRRIKQAFVEVIGNQVLPVLAKFGTWVNTYVVPPLTVIATTFGSILVPTFTGLIKGISGVVGWFKQMGAWMIPITIAVVGFTAAVTASSIATGLMIVAMRAAGLATRIWTGITKIATGVQIAFNAVMNANPVILVITAILALGAALVVAYKKSETFRNIVNGAFGGVLAVGKAIGAWFSGPFVRFFTETIPGAFQAVKNWVSSNWPWILGALTGPIGLAVVWIIKNWDKVTKFFGTAMGAIRDAVSTALSAVVNFFKNLPGRVLAATTALPRLLVERGTALVKGMLSGAASIARTIGSWIRQNIFNPITNFFRNAGSWLVSGGRRVVLGLLAGQLAIARTISTWLRQKIFQPTINFFSRAGSWLTDKGRSIISGLFSGITRRWSDVASWLRGRGSATRSWIGNAAGYLVGKGRDIISGLLSGIKDKWSDAIDWIKGIKDKIVGAIKSAFGISSPARAMFPLGVNIMAGLMKGILSSKGVLKSAVKKIFGSITGVFKKGGKLLGSLVGSIGSALGLGSNTATGNAQEYAQLAMRRYGWMSNQWPALKALWQGESGWNPLAHNASSGAHGIPQALPASKMRSAGADYWTNPVTQINWGLSYIKSRYGSPNAAYSFWLRHSPHWYDSGGLARFSGFIPKMTNEPERVLSPRQTRAFESLVGALTTPGTAAGASGTTLLIEKLVLENHGVIGSRQEVENWLVTTMTTLKRKGRLP